YTVAAMAASGEQALERAESVSPNLVLMDIKLKGKLDGVTVAKEIRERYDIPIVFLTAFADIETVNRAREADPYGYVVKPFTRKALFSNIEMAIYKHQRRKGY
ncbi:MAG: response regulator, partial [Candidatus Margulisbacteria bacterium]|nr:response regulator [Candidatus Margulisiibacteriota bacterium]